MYILFDIGGTKMRVACSRDGETFGEPLKVDTPLIFNDGMAEFQRMIQELCGDEPVSAAAGGIAGPLSADRGMLVNAPRLQKWIGKPLKSEMEKILGTNVLIENDSAVVGLGEAHYGAGRGLEIVAYITVSTGVGGARIIKGVIDKERFGFEPGHQIITAGGALCPQCNVGKEHESSRGELQELVSGPSIEHRFGKKPYDIPQSDPLWGDLARLLAIGLNNTIVHWSPDVVVLGGSMIVGDPAILMDDIERYVKETVTIFPEVPLIKKAELQDVGGLYGSLALLKQYE